MRDGFHFWAFLLGPLWMLWRRMWLVLLIYAVCVTAIQYGLYRLGMSGTVKFAVGFLIALLVGFEAGTLRRWSLRRWTQVGVVVAPSRDEAERRFFETWEEGATLPPSTAPMPPTAAASRPSSEVLGLFPEPQPRS